MNIYVSYVIVNSFTLKLLAKYKAFALTGRVFKIGFKNWLKY